MKILRFFLTVSVLGKYDKKDLEQDLTEKIRELMPDANRNELRIHLCPQEDYDRDLKIKLQAEQKAFNQGKPGSGKPTAKKAPAGKFGSAAPTKNLTSGQQAENKK